MYQLTNQQRRFFALAPVEPHRRELRPKPSPYDKFETVCYAEGCNIKKVTLAGPDIFREYAVDEQLSDDGTMLLPKTPKGRPVLFSTANLLKRTGTGMHLYYERGYISLYSDISNQNFFQSEYTLGRLDSFEDFSAWVDRWCREGDEALLSEVQTFSRKPRKHCKYREGDFFRIQFDRGLYGYGRLIVDYHLMRKDKIPFWDTLIGPALLVGIYHIVTDNPNLGPDDLQSLPMLPPTLMMDNRLYYGEYPIVGNAPLDPADFDCPIHCGKYWDKQKNVHLAYQRGKVFRLIQKEVGLYFDYRNSAVGWSPDVTIALLEDCIRAGSNDPYWRREHWKLKEDLRSPKLQAQRETIEGWFFGQER